MHGRRKAAAACDFLRLVVIHRRACCPDMLVPRQASIVLPVSRKSCTPPTWWCLCPHSAFHLLQLATSLRPSS